jgi:hypothetical protein
VAVAACLGLLTQMLPWLTAARFALPVRSWQCLPWLRASEHHLPLSRLWCEISSWLAAEAVEATHTSFELQWLWGVVLPTNVPAPFVSAVMAANSFVANSRCAIVGGGCLRVDSCGVWQPMGLCRECFQLLVGLLAGVYARGPAFETIWEFTAPLESHRLCASWRSSAGVFMPLPALLQVPTIVLV